MSAHDKNFSQLVTVIGSLGPLQRRFLAAMAAGAQVLKIYQNDDFSAWKERSADGKVVLVCNGLKLNDFRAMRLLLPMICQGLNQAWATEFFYVPAASRDSLNDALTLTQDMPSELRFNIERTRKQAEEAASLDSSSEPPVFERMVA